MFDVDHMLPHQAVQTVAECSPKVRATVGMVPPQWRQVRFPGPACRGHASNTVVLPSDALTTHRGWLVNSDNHSGPRCSISHAMV